ncbi:FHA domain-containing protein [Variovorax sp. Sphag1AA]|uniref:FHA domain-containing protein n=1 Tax=Variovorax sp. Sphag1AA TaxID=2587027 RepID=UPI0016202CD6|nr:FHA domain-containing protein [Variovorax sp. Sphag1AA]MBB3176531.1 pSer/pThr/pTyr-binding forkhead associated (FHA) protein [Variovorax sp. Sphag1AA]
MPRLIVLQKNGSARQVTVTTTPFVIGRSDASDLVLDNQLVSRSHAVFEMVGAAMTIRDLHSHNGTYVNGERRESVALQNGDEIKIGSYQIRFLGNSGPIGEAQALRLVTIPGRLDEIDLVKLGVKPES